MINKQIPNSVGAFFAYILRPRRALLAGTLVLAFLGAAAEGLQPYSIKLMVDEVTKALTNQTPGTEDVTVSFLITGGLFLILRLMVAGSWFFWMRIWRVLAPQSEAMIRKILLNHVLGHPYVWFLNNFAGRTGQRIETIARAFVDILDLVFGLSMYVLMRSLTILALLISVDPWLGLGIVIWVSVFVPVTRKFSQRTEIQSMRWIAANGVHIERVVDIMTNIFHVRANGSTVRDEERACAELVDRAALEHRREADLWNIASFVRTNLNTLLYGVLFLLCLWRYRMGSITLGDYAMVISAGIGLVDTLGDFSKTYQKIFQSIGSLREALEGLVVLGEEKPLLAKPPFVFKAGEIVLQDVSFAYHKHASVFRNFSLTLRAGEKVALVGASGAGKSTLVNLLLGFWQVNSGRIVVDGQDLAHLDRTSFLDHVGVIPQDTSLFHRSLYENIAYGCGDVTLEQVQQAARAAHIHDFIASLPDGYDTQVGERGLKLSGGQRQRIAIARALLKNAQFLILDEATSALDSESEAAIQDSLHRLMPGKTVVAIAHRLSTIAHMDRIIVLEDGQIVEEGNQESLLQQQGLYARLWAMQSGGYLPDIKPLAQDAAKD